MQAAADITGLLKRWSAGDDECKAVLYDHLYEQLHRAALSQLNREHGGRAIQPTELIHETYLKMGSAPDVDWQDRNHFLALAARQMRQILVDRARYERAQCRDRALRVTLALQHETPQKSEIVDMIALDAALTRLDCLNERQASIVELRYFGGLSVAETADVLDCSEATVNRDWRAARLWLYDALALGA